MKRKADSDLSELGRWMRKNRYTISGLTELIRVELGREFLSQRTVENWIYRRSVIPTGKNLKAISAVTSGEVTANSFVEDEP